jgi:uncharacterized membrane protein (UPF0136 family)
MDKIPGSAHVNLSFGALAVAGGIAGYVRKGSKASLIAGVTMGSLLMGSGYLIAFSDNRQYEGHLLGCGASALLALGMAPRALSTGKFMPAGLVSTLGIVAAAYNYHKARDWAPSPKKTT